MKKLSLFSILKEDIDLDKLHPNLIGLYSFVQAMNKSVHASPVPGLTINIIPDRSVKVNPGTFYFSRSSFKLLINPYSPKISFDDSGHDVIHALTTNIAKHFARMRPVKNKFSRGDDSKFNLYRNVVNKSELNYFQKLAAKYGIPSLDKEVLSQTIEQSYEELDRTSDENERKFLLGKINVARKILELFRDAIRAHYNNTYKLKAPSDDLSLTKLVRIKRRRDPRAAAEYGGMDSENLPQYDIEEEFGNAILGDLDSPFSRGISYFIENNKPIENVSQYVDRFIEDFIKVFKTQFSQESLVKFAEKYRNYLETVFNNYNELLARYLKAKGLNMR